MRKIYLLGRGMLFVLILTNAAMSQKVNPKTSGTPLGNCENLFNSFNNQLNGSSQRLAYLSLNLKITNGRSLTAKINFKQSTDAEGKYLVGEIADIPGSSFYLKTNRKSLQGNIVFKNTKQAFKYYSDEKGNAFVSEEDINTIICINYEKFPDHSSAERTNAVAATAASDLQSFPGATGCVLLDFDGQYVSGTYWNSGNPINAAPSGMSDAAIQETWELVSEDFKPFNVNITTSETIYNTYPKNKRMRCIITPTNTAAPGAGGVAYIGSFNWDDDTPCWVFITTTKAAGEASSHEIGHTFGLNHDGRSNPVEGYYAGQGSWAPIMGVGYYNTVTQWSKGEYAFANNTEDDISIISGPTNSIGYRTDDHGNTASTATALTVGSTGIVAPTDNKGIIERATDADFFSFNTGGGNVVLNFNPVTKYADLDILVNLFNSSGALLGSYNPVGLSSILNIVLAQGKYYVSVDGTGNGNPSSDGYSDYASIGYYSISGIIPVVVVANQSPVVAITAPVNGTTYTAPANIVINASASDPDGTIAKVEFYFGSSKLTEDLTSPYSMNLSNLAPGSYTFTARAIDNANAVTTSSPVVIKVNSTNILPVVSFTAPVNGTIYSAHTNITINASASDADGSITKVELYSGTTKVSDDMTYPYSFILNNVSAGSYSFILKATDNTGASATSSSLSIQVTNATINIPPVVSINTPVTGSVVQITAYNLAINITATDPDGSILTVELYDGALKLIQDNTYPYAFTWTNIPSGTYSFVARAIDNLGASTNSVPVVVTINGSDPNSSASSLMTDFEPLKELSAIATPNPFINDFSLQLEGSASADIAIFELCSKEVASHFKIKSGDRIDMSAFRSGIYLIRIRNDDKVIIKRVVKL